MFAIVKKPDGNKDNTFERKDANAKNGKEAIPGHAKKEEIPKLIKHVEKKQVSPLQIVIHSCPRHCLK